MRIIITRALLGLGTLACATAMDSGTTAKAAAWCVWHDYWTYNCGYHTYQQCMESARGVGYCARNVSEWYGRDDGSYDEPAPRHHRRHRHHDDS